MQTLTVCGGTLFDVACRVLDDASQWGLIAQLNKLTDPWLDGLNMLTVPNAGSDNANGG